MKAVTTEEQRTTLKGRMVSITVLVLQSTDLGEIDCLLQEKSSQAPGFFNGAPLLLDVENLPEDVDAVWLNRLSEIVTDKGFMPVGLIGADDALKELAHSTGTPVWPSGGSSRNSILQKNEDQDTASPLPESPDRSIEESHPQRDTVARAAGNAAEQAFNEKGEKSIDNQHSPTMVVDSTVRSGQRVYAKGGDLIVLASVNTGAEVMADGHIHVYGVLRGKALAGAQGNKAARIFCHSLQADLIAVAGYYLTNDDLPAEKRGCAVQISLSQEHLNIDAL